MNKMQNHSRNTIKSKSPFSGFLAGYDGFGNEGPLPAARGSSSFSSSFGFHQ